MDIIYYSLLFFHIYFIVIIILPLLFLVRHYRSRNTVVNIELSQIVTVIEIEKVISSVVLLDISLSKKLSKLEKIIPYNFFSKTTPMIAHLISEGLNITWRENSTISSDNVCLPTPPAPPVPHICRQTFTEHNCTLSTFPLDRILIRNPH